MFVCELTWILRTLEYKGKISGHKGFLIRKFYCKSYSSEVSGSKVPILLNMFGLILEENIPASECVSWQKRNMFTLGFVSLAGYCDIIKW